MKNANISMLLIALAVSGIGTTAVNGTIIPLAQTAKDHAMAPEVSGVITFEDGDWLLNVRGHRRAAGIPELTGVGPVFEDGSKIIPLAPQGMEHGRGAANSPAIDLIDGEWVVGLGSLTPSAEHKSLDSVVDSTIPGADETGPSGSHTPEPATLLLLGFGALVIRRRSIH